jgi:hypothetical protein
MTCPLLRMTLAKELAGDMPSEEDGVNSSHSGRSSPPDLCGVGDGEKGVAAGLRDEGGGRRAWVMVVGRQRRQRGWEGWVGCTLLFLGSMPYSVCFDETQNVPLLGNKLLCFFYI